MHKVVPPFVRSAFNYDRDAVSDESGLRCDDPSLAQQQFADECDINTIMRRFGQGAQMPENFEPPSYADFTEATDYHSAMNAVARAHEAFDALPAELRYRFQNDPGQMLDFLGDVSNRDEAVKLGLVPPPPEVVLPVGAPVSGVPEAGVQEPPKAAGAA